ncbi:MAG: SusC/RagA family TonB-linked outer membrane protein, partial [Tannerellaceae bacterium]
MYDNRYLVEVNGRYDGTSRFPSDNRFVFLPSFSGAWRISEEAFMKDALSWMDNLKIRASYGALGNQLLTASGWGGNTKYYPYIPFMSSGSAGNWLFNDNEKLLYINPAGLVSNSLTWEKASTFNIGADVTLLNQKLDVSFDWYQRTTSDMLVKVEYPEILGTTAPPANKAELRTRGWELSVKWNDQIGKDFRYDIGVILSDSQAEITKYENKTGSLGDYYEGQKIGEIWGYETGGFFQYAEDVANHADQSKLGSNWAPGDIKYIDLNGDNKINNGANTLSDHGDLRIIGNTTPRYQYGISANMTYQNVYLNVFFQGIGKRDFWPSSQPFWPVATQYYNTQQWFYTDSWSEDNRDAYFARPIARETKNQQKQTKYIQDASYCRLKNLSLGYNLPSSWLSSLHISRANVYFSAENLFEFSNIKGAYDPEAASKNGAMIYPFQRTYSFGVNVTF